MNLRPVLNMKEQGSQIERKNLTFMRDLFFVGMLLALLANFLVSSYANLKPTEMLIFHSNDGWCESDTEGIGNHCFGDFAYGFKQESTSLLNDSPWTVNKNWTYPPLALLYFKPFYQLKILTGNPSIPLYTHLLISIFCLLFPVLHLFTRKIISLRRSFIISTIILCLAPSLMIIDRGNNLVVLLPFLYLFYIKFLQEKYNVAVVFIALMTIWRPQMFLLSLAFLPRRQWYMIIKTSAMSVAFLVTSFFVYQPGKFIENISAWLENSRNYQGIQTLPSGFPTNWSFANSSSMIFDLLRKLLLNSSDTSLKISAQDVQNLSIIFLLVTGFLLYKSRIRNRFQILIISTLLPILSPGVTFGYYLSLLIIPAILIMTYLLKKEESVNSIEEKFIYQYVVNLLGRGHSRALTAATILLVFVPWPLTSRLWDNSYQDPTSALSITWLAAPVFLLIWFFLNFRTTTASNKEH